MISYESVVNWEIPAAEIYVAQLHGFIREDSTLSCVTSLSQDFLQVISGRVQRQPEEPSFIFGHLASSHSWYITSHNHRPAKNEGPSYLNVLHTEVNKGQETQTLSK